MHSVEFSVPFVMGKARPRFTRSGRAYTPAKTQDAEKQIALAFTEQSKRILTDKQISIQVDTYRPLPKSRPKKVVSEPDTVKPDADNILKLVCDGLNGIAYKDDAQITKALVTKHPRIREQIEKTNIKVTYLEENERQVS